MRGPALPFRQGSDREGGGLEGRRKKTRAVSAAERENPEWK